MLSASLKSKKLLRFLLKNPLLLVFGLVILFVVIVASFKILFSKPNYVYAKIKVGQGLWWAVTAKPLIWQIDSINKGDTMAGFLGQTQAEIISKRYYKAREGDQFDIYLIAKLNASLNKKTGVYNFNRYALSVGSPIELQFPKQQITGTVIAVNKNPFEDKLIEKTIYLSKRGALPWEYDAIKIGDNYFNGEDKILEILDKSSLEITNLSWDTFGNSTANITEPGKYITLKAKVKVKQANNQWIFGEDQLVVPGKVLYISTPNFVFDNYLVSKIE